MSETNTPYEQSLPSDGRQSVTAALRALLDQREAKGIATYGRSLETFNGRSAPRDLVEELIDATQYALQWQIEREELLRQVDEWQALATKSADDVALLTSASAELRAHVARLTWTLERRTWYPAVRPDQSLTGVCPDCLQSRDRGHHCCCGIGQSLALTPEAIAADAEVLKVADELSTARRAYLRWFGIGPISDETHADWILFLEAQEKLDVAVDRSRKARGAT